MPPLIQLLRPHQWLKNGFVLVGLLFGHAWSNAEMHTQALAAFVAFCLISSAVYVMNDILDREADRRHPQKCLRPIASGRVGIGMALALAAVCLVVGLGLISGLFGLPASKAPWVFVSYVLMNVAYSLGLKHVVILDVFIIAAGFMLRIFAGTLGIGIAPSHWLVLTGLMLTLFLGFAKRRAEIEVPSTSEQPHRRVLEQYSLPLLDQFITLTAGATVITYSLYTVSEETIALHGTRWLIVTVPCVLYGLLRYLYRLHRRGGGGDPVRELLRDPHLMGVALLWLGLVIGLLA
ncbi:decaprenyl-phosphate phosphoribosyltransferase [Sulfuricystis multivorans]|uniref:decaprenyl-phosphate phosphoribosyltransferase n=1 Tax=Sulfuricystis multivorans TaxID=2211108 RepID=UPI0024DFE3D4|nr:decaprenyl-phosphate phosphoribosyltransferase [Sulfuricystis multivorans]